MPEGIPREFHESLVVLGVNTKVIINYDKLMLSILIVFTTECLDNVVFVLQVI